MDLQLQGRTILVTGGSRGLGRELAVAAAREGMRVAICARNAEDLEDCAAAVRELGSPCHPMVANLFDASDCLRVVDETVKKLGAIDVLVNNASTSVAGAPFFSAGLSPHAATSAATAKSASRRVMPATPARRRRARRPSRGGGSRKPACRRP